MLNNPITEPQVPEQIARDAEYIAADLAHQNATNPHPQYLPLNPVGIEFAQAALTALDFHTGATYRDFDARILASGGGAANGLGDLLVQCVSFRLNAGLLINGGAGITKLLSVTTSVDLPLLAAGATTDLSINIANAAVGDFAFFAPTQLVTNISFLNIRAIINASGVAQVRFHNLATVSVDVAAFTGRLLVIGFQ